MIVHLVPVQLWHLWKAKATTSCLECYNWFIHAFYLRTICVCFMDVLIFRSYSVHHGIHTVFSTLLWLMSPDVWQRSSTKTMTVGSSSLRFFMVQSVIVETVQLLASNHLVPHISWWYWWQSDNPWVIDGLNDSLWSISYVVCMIWLNFNTIFFSPWPQFVVLWHDAQQQRRHLLRHHITHGVGPCLIDHLGEEEVNQNHFSFSFPAEYSFQLQLLPSITCISSVAEPLNLGTCFTVLPELPVGWLLSTHSGFTVHLIVHQQWPLRNIQINLSEIEIWDCFESDAFITNVNLLIPDSWPNLFHCWPLPLELLPSSNPSLPRTHNIQIHVGQLWFHPALIVLYCQ